MKKDGRATTNIFCFEPKVCFEIYHMHHSTLKQYQISKQTEVGYSKFNSIQSKTKQKSICKHSDHAWLVKEQQTETTKFSKGIPGT